MILITMILYAGVCKSHNISSYSGSVISHFMFKRRLPRSNILVSNMTCASLENDKKVLAAMKFRLYENKIWVSQRSLLLKS